MNSLPTPITVPHDLLDPQLGFQDGSNDWLSGYSAGYSKGFLDGLRMFTTPFNEAEPILPTTSTLNDLSSHTRDDLVLLARAEPTASHDHDTPTTSPTFSQEPAHTSSSATPTACLTGDLVGPTVGLVESTSITSDGVLASLSSHCEPIPRTGSPRPIDKGVTRCTTSDELESMASTDYTSAIPSTDGGATSSTNPFQWRISPSSSQSTGRSPKYFAATLAVAATTSPIGSSYLVGSRHDSPIGFGSVSLVELGSGSPTVTSGSPIRFTSPAECGSASLVGSASPVECGSASSIECNSASPVEPESTSPVECGSASPTRSVSPVELDSASSVECSSASLVECGSASPTRSASPVECSSASPVRSASPVECSSASPTRSASPVECSSGSPTVTSSSPIRFTSPAECGSASLVGSASPVEPESTSPVECGSASPTRSASPVECSSDSPVRSASPARSASPIELGPVDSAFFTAEGLLPDPEDHNIGLPTRALSSLKQTNTFGYLSAPNARGDKAASRCGTKDNTTTKETPRTYYYLNDDNNTWNIFNYQPNYHNASTISEIKKEKTTNDASVISKNARKRRKPPRSDDDTGKHKRIRYGAARIVQLEKSFQIKSMDLSYEKKKERKITWTKRNGGGWSFYDNHKTVKEAVLLGGYSVVSVVALPFIGLTPILLELEGDKWVGKNADGDCELQISKDGIRYALMNDMEEATGLYRGKMR
ncbi:gramicidin synthase [Ilyonectria robusta]